MACSCSQKTKAPTPTLKRTTNVAKRTKTIRRVIKKSAYIHS